MTTPNLLPDQDSVAIIGMSCRLPGAPDVQTYWRNLLAAEESISFPSDAQLRDWGVDAALLADPAFVKAGGLLASIEDFDATFFGYTPREASLMEPQHRLFLECAWEALEHAGYTGRSHDGAIGVFGGAAMNAYLLLNLATRPDVAPALFDFQVQIGNDKDYLTTRVSYKLDLKGPSLNVQTACSTSLVAVHVACQSLLGGECNLALAGGVAVSLPQQLGHRHLAGGIHSVDGHCRAFDAAATGTVFSSGAGVVALKRLADALADGDHVHAVIRGSAVNNDGHAKVGFTAPGVDGQAAVITEALAVAGVPADSIGFVECHGTGTAVGDPIEVQALTQAFRQTSQRTGFCTLGSVKSNIGHLDVASGVAGLIKATLAVEQGRIPATLHYRSPNPEIDFASSPFQVNAALSDWPAGLRRAGVSSFGLGGTNAHVVLEQAPAPPAPDACRPHALVLLSAKTPVALAQMAERLAAHLEQHPEQALADVAFTLQTGREAFARRRAWVAADRAALIDALRQPDRHPDRQAQCGAVPGRVVFMFPGQGAQHVDMARDLHVHEPVFREALDRCADLLRGQLGLDLRDLLFPPAAQREDAARQLQQTWITQPALFAVEYSLARLWMGWGIQPQALIGHSIGEYVAACLAGVMTLDEALRLVAARGRLMQDLPGGAMLAVDLPESALGDLTLRGLDLAAVNGASRCVVSGPASAVDAFEARLVASGHRCRRLATSHAFHSAMMDPVLDRFAALVASVDLRPPQIPMISNLSGTWLTPGQATDPAYYAQHLRGTVRFAAGLALASAPAGSILLEVGPGRTLAATLGPPSADRPDAPMVLGSLRHPQQPEADTAVLMGTLGRLWCAGQPVDWAAVHAPQRRRRLALPTYPFERQRHWIEPGRRAALAPAPAVPTQDRPVRPAAVTRLPIEQRFYQPVWRPATLPKGQCPASAEGPWLVFADASPQGQALVRRLEQTGQRVLAVLPMGPEQAMAEPAPLGLRLHGQLREDYERLVDTLQEGGLWPRHILHAWNLGPARPGGLAPAAFDAAQDLGLNSLLMLVQALAARQITHPMSLTVLGSGLLALDQAEPLAPERAPLAAACTVLSQEFPQLDCRCVDVPWPSTDQDAATLVDRVLDEIRLDAPDRVVAWRGEARWVCKYEPLSLGAVGGTPRRLRAQGVYLITGGLGAIGGALSDYLARTVQARLVLTGRTPLPPREDWPGWLASHPADDPGSQRIHRVMALEALGAEVMVVAADVADAQQMGAAWAQAERRFGRIDGVIHGAGVVADDAFLPVQDSHRANTDLHLRPKVQGLRVLQTLLEDRPVDFVLLQSSISSVLGGLGYTAYAAANRVLDAQAQLNARQSPGRWISVNWDAWQPEVAQAAPPRMGSIVASLAMSTAEGVEAFARILDQADLPQVIVSTTDLPTRVAQWALRRPRGEASAASAPAASPADKPASGAAWPVAESRFATEMQATLASIWCQVLGIGRVEPTDNFFDVGGDSLLLMDVIARLKTSVGVTLNPREIMFQSLAQIAAQCDAQRPPAEAQHADPTPTTAAPRKAGLIDSLRMKMLGGKRAGP